MSVDEKLAAIYDAAHKRTMQTPGLVEGLEAGVDVLKAELRTALERIEALEREAKIDAKKWEGVERMPFCADHRDKLRGKPCRECRIEALEALLGDGIGIIGRLRQDDRAGEAVIVEPFLRSARALLERTE